MKDKQSEFDFKENKKTDYEVFSEWYREWRKKQDVKRECDRPESKVKQKMPNK